MVELLEPVVHITPAVIEQMADEVLRHPRRETAWGIVGVRQNGTSIITGVVLPSASDVVRNFATASFGGTGAAERVQWLLSNWDYMKELGLNPDDTEFVIMYKGHSHHGLQPFGFPRYSGTDERSILEAVTDENGLDEAVGPLAVCSVSEPTIRLLHGKRGITYRRSAAVHFVFYYLSKKMVEAGITRPILIRPVLVDDPTQVPVTPPEGWHHAHEAEFQRELDLLQGYGCEVAVNYREIEGGPPYEIVLSVDRNTWRNMLTITTFWDHPNTPPKFKVTELGRNRSPSTHFAGTPALLEGPIWEKGQPLLIAVFALEAGGKL